MLNQIKTIIDNNSELNWSEKESVFRFATNNLSENDVTELNIETYVELIIEYRTALITATIAQELS